jgi:hypothetical protein
VRECLPGCCHPIHTERKRLAGAGGVLVGDAVGGGSGRHHELMLCVIDYKYSVMIIHTPVNVDV